MTTTNQFQFNTQDVRIVLDERGEPLFVGKDVCEVLGYTNPNKTMEDHCRGVTKRYPIFDSLNRVQEVRVLTEGDVMRLIVRSKLPAAVEFERLVFDEVLPSIRKTGKYRIGQKPARVKRPPVIPDGIYPATIIHCDILEKDRFTVSAMIDVGEYAGLLFKAELSMHIDSEERSRARNLISDLTKAAGLVMATDTSQFLQARVAIKVQHKWHKNRPYNTLSAFKTRPGDMPAPATEPPAPLLAWTPPPKPTAEESYMLADKAKPRVLPSPRKALPAPVEYLNDQQLKKLRDAISEACRGGGTFSFQIYNWLYNQMDVRDETRIPKTRFAEALRLVQETTGEAV